MRDRRDDDGLMMWRRCPTFTTTDSAPVRRDSEYCPPPGSHPSTNEELDGKKDREGGARCSVARRPAASGLGKCTVKERNLRLRLA